MTHIPDPPAPRALPPRPLPARGRVELWWWQLDAAPGDGAQAGLLSPAEHARAARFARPLLREHFTAARAGLRRILAAYAGLPPAELDLAEGELGKPFLRTRAGAPSRLRFNLSHSEAVAALAVATDVEVGVDIEGMKVVEPAVAERFFAPDECLALSRLGGPAWREAFFRCWTRKEAVLKASGRGLHAPLDSFAVSLDSAAAARVLRASGVLAGAEAWALLPFALGDTMPGAVAVASPEPHRLRRVGSPNGITPSEAQFN